MTTDDEGERGMTMIELIIAMAIGAVVCLLAVYVLVATLRTQGTVAAGTQAATQGQTVSELIDRAVRTSDAVKVSDGRLDLHTSGGGCQAFAADSAGVHHTTSTSGAITTAVTTWPLLAGQVSQIGSTPYFAAQPGGVAYSFRLQGSTGPVDIVSSAVLRVSAGSGAPCF